MDPRTASRILPGARNFEDIEKYLNEQKKKKQEALKSRNKW